MKFSEEEAVNNSYLPGLAPFIPDFISERFKDLDQLDVFLKNQQWKEVKSITHKWKGFCEPYGFAEMIGHCQVIEERILNGQHDSFGPLLDEVRSYLLKKKEELINERN